jgi:predicted nucleic acid-binding protein
VTPTFVDTNILAYARDRRAHAKQVVAEGWLSALARRREGRISTQVLIEYYAVATHPQKLDLPAAAAQADCRALHAWEPVAPDSELFDSAWSVQERHGFSWWDALIVAAALRQDCSLLLTEDMQHGLVVDNRLTLVNPFASDAPLPPAAP